MQSTRLGWQLIRSVRGSELTGSRQLKRRGRLRTQLQQSNSESVKSSVWVHATCLSIVHQSHTGGAEVLWEVEEGAEARRVSCVRNGGSQPLRGEVQKQ